MAGRIKALWLVSSMLSLAGCGDSSTDGKGGAGGKAASTGSTSSATAGGSGGMQTMPVDGTGKECSKNEDCPSGICLDDQKPGRCTTTCDDTSDCVAGWACGILTGTGKNVCQCTPHPEKCNALDDDCNGIVDDGSDASAACISSLGPSYQCVAGTCSCVGKIENEEWCKPVNQDCDHVCDVGMGQPKTDLARATSAQVKRFSGTGDPDLSCYQVGKYPSKPGAPENVTVSGVARIFSHGCASTNLKISFSTVKRSGGPDDGKLLEVLGSAVTTPADCTATGVASADDQCGTLYECKYSYPGVPTETELAVKTEGDLWAPVITYNVYFPSSAVTGGAVSMDVTALSIDDYAALAQAAEGGPVSGGNAVLIGEVHDCGDVRLANAVAGIDQAKKKFAYFTSDETHPLPDLAAKATSPVSDFAAFDIAPGPVRVAAEGQVGGTFYSLGAHSIYLYPDSVTMVTLRGLQPYQLP